MKHQKKRKKKNLHSTQARSLKEVHNCSSPLRANIIILFSYAFHLALSPQRSPQWRPLSLSENPFECVEASFFTLPLGLCCQRAALRKSLFLPGWASCVPPPSPSVLMVVPPTHLLGSWSQPGQGFSGGQLLLLPSFDHLTTWKHNSWPHVSTDKEKKQREKRGRVRMGCEEEKKSPFHLSWAQGSISLWKLWGELAQMVRPVFPLMVIIYLDRGNRTYYGLSLATAWNKVLFQFATHSFVSAAEREREKLFEAALVKSER